MYRESDEMNRWGAIGFLQKFSGKDVDVAGKAVGQGLTASAARQLGLKPATPVSVSLIDAYAGALGLLATKTTESCPLHQKLGKTFLQAKYDISRSYWETCESWLVKILPKWSVKVLNSRPTLNRIGLSSREKVPVLSVPLIVPSFSNEARAHLKGNRLWPRRRSHC